MFTVCPKCALTLVVTAADLRVAQGYVRCGRCSNVFNALARLSEDRQASASPAQAQPSSVDATAANKTGATGSQPRPADTTFKTRQLQDPAATGKTRQPSDTSSTSRLRQQPEIAPAPAARKPAPAAPEKATRPAPPPPPEPKRYGDDTILEEDLEFNPDATDVTKVFVEQSPSPEFTAATGTFKALRAEAEAEESRTEQTGSRPAAHVPPTHEPYDPADTQVDVEIDPDLLDAMAQLTGNRLPKLDLNSPPPTPTSTAKAPDTHATAPPAPATYSTPAPAAYSTSAPAGPMSAPGGHSTPAPATPAAAPAQAPYTPGAPATYSTSPPATYSTPPPPAPTTHAAAPSAYTMPPAPAHTAPTPPASPARSAAPAKAPPKPVPLMQPPMEQPPQAPAPMRLAERAKARAEAARPVSIETAHAIRQALLPRKRSPVQGTTGDSTEAPPTSFFAGMWTAGSVLLLLLLLGQVVNHYRNDLAANESLNGPLTSVYAVLGIPLVPRWNLESYEVRQLGASTAADAPGQITVRASVKNGAHQPQPLPLLRVTLQDRFGNRIAARDVPPQSYLPRAIPSSSLLSAGQRIDAEMAFVDPGANAVGFEIDACLPSPDGGIACASDSARQ